MDDNEKISLQQAFCWQCPECGEENFCKGIQPDMPQEEYDDLVRKLYGLDEFEEIPQDVEFDLIAEPDEVHCQKCNEEYPVLHDSIDIEDDDWDDDSDLFDDEDLEDDESDEDLEEADSEDEDEED